MNNWATGRRNGMNTCPECVPRGEGHVRSKLTEAEVREIRKSRKSALVLATRYGVGRTAIWNIRNFVTWAHLE